MRLKTTLQKEPKHILLTACTVQLKNAWTVLFELDIMYNFCCLKLYPCICLLKSHIFNLISKIMRQMKPVKGDEWYSLSVVQTVNITAPLLPLTMRYRHITGVPNPPFFGSNTLYRLSRLTRPLELLTHTTITFPLWRQIFCLMTSKFNRNLCDIQ